MTAKNESAARRRTTPEDEAQLEARATRLLMESLQVLGRGEYPFYTARSLRRKAATERALSISDETDHPRAPQRDITCIWQLARRANLTSLQADLLRILAAGAQLPEAAVKLKITRRRARGLLRRAMERMKQHIAELRVSTDQQIAAVLYEEQRRRGYTRERHCKPGQEACRRSGLCTKRWYLR